MTYKKRLLLMAALPAAFALTGCQSRTGLAEKGPDSGAPVPGNPDTAGPVASVDVPGVDTTSTVQPAGTANLTVSPPNVDFGMIDVGATSPPVVVTVTNVGNGTSGPLTVTVAGTGIMVSGCSGMTLAPQANCILTITAKLTTVARISGTIEVGDSAAGSKKISVTGIFVSPGMRWTLAPSPLDLGTVVMGKTTTGSIAMTNGTLFDLTGIVITVSGTGFSRAATGTCTDTLASGQFCLIDVSFAATVTGSAKGTVTVQQGGVTTPVPVTAMVPSLGAALVIRPTAASLETVVGTPSSPVIFDVAGDVSTGVTVTLAGANAKDFSFTSSCPTVGTGGTSSSCQVSVVYNPKTAPATNSTATLTVAQPGTSGASASATLSGSLSPVDRIPVDNTVSGWTIDTESNMGGSAKPMVATTMDEGTSLIDGGIEPFYADGFSPKLFIWQNYKNSRLPSAPADSSNPKGATLSLYVLRLPSADQASGLYQNLLKYSEYTRKKTATSSGWEEPTPPLLGAKSRIQDTGADWFINFQKNEYYVEISLTPSNGPAPDFTPSDASLKQEALRFAQAVASRL
jgi:hypothetical protein